MFYKKFAKLTSGVLLLSAASALNSQVSVGANSMSDLSMNGEIKHSSKNVLNGILKFVGISVLFTAVVVLLFFVLARGIKFVQLNEINRKYSRLRKDLQSLRNMVNKYAKWSLKGGNEGVKAREAFAGYIADLENRINYFRDDNYDNRFIEAVKDLKDCAIDLQKKYVV